MSRPIMGGALTPVIIFDQNGTPLGTTGAPLLFLPEPISGYVGDVNAPASNTAATVTYAAVAGERHVITGFAVSYYGGIPTGGNVTITSAGVIIFNLDIAEEGAGEIIFPAPKSGGVNSDLVITLTAGGAGITGKLNILNHWTEVA
jgi:hypothetical protein